MMSMFSRSGSVFNVQMTVPYIARRPETDTISKAMVTFAAVNWEEALPTILYQSNSSPLYIANLQMTLTIPPKQ